MISRLGTLLVVLVSAASTRCAHGGAIARAGIHVFEAAARGDAEGVARWVEGGGDVDARDELLGNTPLMVAAHGGHPRAIEVLIAAGADVNLASTTGGWTALMYAAHFGRKEAVELLVAAGADVDAIDEGEPPTSVLMHAAMTGHGDIARLLVKAGAAEDVFAAAAIGDAEFVRDYLRKGGDPDVVHRPDGWTPLANAAQYGHEEVVRILVQAGADLNADVGGLTALRCASVAGRAGIVGLLKRSGAKDFPVSWGRLDVFSAPLRFDADYVRGYLRGGGTVDVRNGEGQTPLMIAALVYPPIVKILLAAGADPNATDAEGWTALMSAALRGELDALRLLLDAGAQVDARDLHGWTALMRAAERGHLEAVKLLRARGAETQATNVHGQTASALAALHRHDGVVSALQR